nr:23S rRNA (adenine(1618)-N(6))-methyltransferase RlmF [Nibricoccus aquaticus]
MAALPELAPFVQPHPLAGDTIDFANPAAVLTLNRALLKLHYGIAHWDLPSGFLCPPVPSRADYLHHAADLLAADTADKTIPCGPAIRALDLGTGANAIYPLLAASLFGWRVTGTDIDPASINWARQLAAANPPLAPLLDFRLQPSASALFANITAPTDSFALSLCNPPFHASPDEAAAGTLRKIRNLGSPTARSSAKLALNFGGRPNELWCPGGEVAFIRRMIAESAARPALCVWFTTLVSKRASLPLLERALHSAHPHDVRIITMFAGQKQSRLLAWTFLSPAERRTRLTSVTSTPA